MKKAFKKAEDLYLIEPGFKFDIYSYMDALINELGARLYQCREKEDRRYVIAYANRSFKGAVK